MAAFALRIKTKEGHHVLKNLTADNTIKDLKTQLSTVSSIPQERLHVLSGFPPKVFDMSQENVALNKSGLTSGDTLILEEKTAPVAVANKAAENPKDSQTYKPHITEDSIDCPGILMKKVVPADNSCLFSSIYFVLNGKLDDAGTANSWMRQLIAESVSKDQGTYSDAVLGKPNADYCAWIQDDKSWGGAIEISILANYYGIEIDVVDTINAIINRFGEDQHYALRVFLMFDGIHYDPLYLEPLDGGNIQTMFPTEDERIFKEAEVLAKEANSSRQFTDVNKFTLQCLNCNTFLKGQLEAREHAQKSGHMNFGEV